MNKINISIKPIDYNGSHNTHFRNVVVDKSDLENIFKSYNYSLITWKVDEEKKEYEYNRKRNIKNFETAYGLAIDIDENLSIDDAENKLKNENINYVIVTSRNHQKDTTKGGKFSPAQDRYHIILFFNKVVTDPDKYVDLYSYFTSLFPNLDTKCKSLDRFLFGSPSDAEYYSWFDGKDVDVDEVKAQETDFLNMPVAEDKKLWEFDNDLKVELIDGRIAEAIKIRSQERCHCPRPEHSDNNPSALISFNEKEDKWIVYCFGCGYTGWSRLTKEDYDAMVQMQNFYYLGKDIYEMGIAEDKFFLTKNSEKNFCYTIGAESKEKQDSAIKNLIKSRRLRTLTRVDYVGNPETNESFYSVSPADGLITVNIAAIRSDVVDNQFIEKYLKNTFGQYKDFIKQYLAMYSYTIHTNLPTLILYGPRGCGKTTFAGLVADIYPSLYLDWSGESGNFSQECEKKLLVIEENLIDEKSQYKTLKKYTGQEYLLVNKKYQPEYMVKNNLNIILISNEMIPLYVEKTEKPADPTNNQFFVWEFSSLNKTIDGTFSQKLRERLGHYIGTELKTVFSGINKNYTRYGISVPITNYEEQLFDNNTTNIEAQADLVLEKIANRNNTFLPNEDEYDLYETGYIAYSLIEEFASGPVHPNAIIKNLKKRKIIEQGMVRKQVNKKRYSSYKIIKLP